MLSMSLYGLIRMVSSDLKGCFRIKYIPKKAQDTICKSAYLVLEMPS